MDRRQALKGIAGIIAAVSAPAIIPIKNIMPVKPVITTGDVGWQTMAARVTYGKTTFGDFERLIMQQMAESMAIEVDEIMMGFKTITYLNRGQNEKL